MHKLLDADPKQFTQDYLDHKDALKSQNVRLSGIFCSISFQETINLQMWMWNCSFLDKQELFSNYFLLANSSTVYTVVHLQAR